MKKNKSIQDMIIDGELTRRQAITAIKNKLRRKSELMILKDGKKKNCDHCDKDANIMYRVQIDTTKKWIFICKSCLNHLKPGNKSYRYGGTWKA